LRYPNASSLFSPIASGLALVSTKAMTQGSVPGGSNWHRAALHDHVSGAQADFRAVELHVDLAGDDDGIIERVGAMNPRRHARPYLTMRKTVPFGTEVATPPLRRRFRRDCPRKLSVAPPRSWRSPDAS
jgi:hypothetical protein